MEQASISVIVPIYNAEKYLNDCITSIVQQTVPNLEIILVDDGSPDRCGDMCDEWAKKDTRIRVLHQKNLGVSAARNAGIQAANGDLISFVDADDVLPSGAYEHFLFSMDDADLVMGRMQHIDKNGILYGTESIIPPEKTSVEFFLTDLFQEKEYGYLGYLWDKLFRRDIICQNTIWFNERIKLNEDRLFILQYAICCHKISFCPECVYYYRQHDSGTVISNRNASTVTDAEMTVIDSFSEMLGIAKKHSEKLYYIIAHKTFENALAFFKRVNRQDVIKVCYLRHVIWHNAKLCLQNPTYTVFEKAKIIGHCVLKR